MFGKGLHKYSFENTCKELPELSLGDESTKIFLCAGSNADDVSDDMKDFLEWLAGQSACKSKLVQNLIGAVQKARNHEEWRLEYMTLLMRDQEMIQKGREEGRMEGQIEGHKTGLVEGRDQTLFSLVQDGILEPSVAAEKANMSLGEFEVAMQKAGYSIHMPL